MTDNDKQREDAHAEMPNVTRQRNSQAKTSRSNLHEGEIDRKKG